METPADRAGAGNALMYRVNPSKRSDSLGANRSARLGGVPPGVSSNQLLAPIFTKLIAPSPGVGRRLGSELGVEDQQGRLAAGDRVPVVGEGDSLCRTARRRGRHV